MLRRIGLCSFIALVFVRFASAQDASSRIVFSSREYRAIGQSYLQQWIMTVRDRQKMKYSSGTCTPQPMESTGLLGNTKLPDRSDHWNYLTGISPSPDGRLLLIGSEAGSSSSHFEDYWLFDRASRTWRYAGGGNGAQWSPDSSTILWSTPRELAPIGKIHVWVSHLILVDVGTLQQQPLTSGVSDESGFFWCTSGDTPMATLRDRFQKAPPVRPNELVGAWVLIRNIETERFINGREGPDHVEFDAGGVRSITERQDVPRSAQGDALEWVSTFRMLTAGQIEVTSDASWLPTDDKSPVTINASGEAVFSKAYRAGPKRTYQCRLAGPRNLICLLRGQEDGHGIEFLRR